MTGVVAPAPTHPYGLLVELVMALQGRPSKVALAVGVVGATLVLDVLVRGTFHMFALFAAVPLVLHARSLGGWAGGFELFRDRIVVRGPFHHELPASAILAVQLSERRSRSGDEAWTAVVLWARVGGRTRSYVVDGVDPATARAFVREVAAIAPHATGRLPRGAVIPSLVGWFLGCLAVAALFAAAVGVTPSPAILLYALLTTTIVHGTHLHAFIDPEGALGLWRSLSSNPRRSPPGPYRV